MQSDAVLAIELDGTWTVGEYARFLTALEEIFAIHVAVERLGEQRLQNDEHAERVLHAWLTREPTSRVPYPERAARSETVLGVLRAHLLDVLTTELVLAEARAVQSTARLEILSMTRAGLRITDLVGVGRSIAELWKLIHRLTEHYSNRHMRAQHVRTARLKNDRLEIENAERVAKLARTLGVTFTEARKLVRELGEREEVVGDAIVQGKVRSAHLLPATGDQSTTLRAQDSPAGEPVTFVHSIAREAPMDPAHKLDELRPGQFPQTHDLNESSDRVHFDSDSAPAQNTRSNGSSHGADKLLKRKRAYSERLSELRTAEAELQRVYAAALDTAPAEDAGARARHAQSHEMALADLNRQRIVTTDALDSVQAELDELFAITRG